MLTKHLTLLFITGLLLSGCNKLPVASCSSSDTLKLINKSITDQAETLTVEKRYDQYDGSFVFGATKIRASLAQIQMAVENVNLLKQDPNSSKSYCSAMLKVIVPPVMLSDADMARDSQQQSKIAQYANQLNIENKLNVFTQDIKYSVTPTGDGKEPHLELEGAAWVHLLDEITTAALLKPTVELQETFYVQKNETPKQELEPLKTKVATVLTDADRIKAALEKQGLDKLNQELLEAEQVEKELANSKAGSESVESKTTLSQISPSFNCEHINKSTEMTICNNPELAALDVENFKIYKDAKNINPVATKEIWMESIKSKYACGTDIDCITNIYKKSIENYSCVANKELDCSYKKIESRDVVE